MLYTRSKATNRENETILCSEFPKRADFWHCFMCKTAFEPHDSVHILNGKLHCPNILTAVHGDNYICGRSLEPLSTNEMGKKFDTFNQLPE